MAMELEHLSLSAEPINGREDPLRTEDLRVKRCNILKRKCEEYEEMNENLLAQTKRIRSIIMDAKKEKSILIKRLEQFEVLDEVPKTRFLEDSDTQSDSSEDEKALLVTAVKIRAELESELARLKPQASGTNSKLLNSAHHTHMLAGNTSPTNTPDSRVHVASMPLESPISSAMVSPSSIAVPTTAAVSKGKKPKAKAHSQISIPSVKKKAHSRGGSSKKRKPDSDPNAPKKPSNAFFWFCQEKRAPLQEKFRGEGMSGQHDLTKALARLWSETAAEDKKKYYFKYTVDKERYDKEVREYTSKMKHTTASPGADNDSKDH